MNIALRGALAGSLALLGAACTQSAAPSVSPGPTATSLGLPDGTGCSGEVARFRAVLESDVETGNVARSVYNRAEPDIARAQAACAAGRDSEARAIVASTKARFGYR